MKESPALVMQPFQPRDPLVMYSERSANVFHSHPFGSRLVSSLKESSLAVSFDCAKKIPQRQIEQHIVEKPNIRRLAEQELEVNLQTFPACLQFVTALGAGEGLQGRLA
ncbi:hypothetical protein ACS0Y3_29390 [Burkholderia gladioli]|uniref:hypothetical protein n=1 Tax=Burkholderia gladioli TaxID=28095 RepID=UPI0016418F59|nr:hypothetical protein [Burkholderia gladioli]